MNGQALGSHRRLDTIESTPRLSSPAFWPTTRAHFASQEVKNLQFSQSKSRSLGTPRASQGDSLPLFQKPKKGEHHPLQVCSAGECWDPVTEGSSLLPITEMLPSGFVKRLELGTRRGTCTNPKEAWTEKNLEATASIENQGKGRPMTFPNQVNNQGEKPQNSQGQGHKDLWKDIIIRYGIVSPRRGLHMVSQYPKQTGNLEGHVLEGRKIHLKSRQGRLSPCSLEESQEEVVQTPKKEKAKGKRAKKKEAQNQFSREKAFLQRKLEELGPMPVTGVSLLDKRKTQALELSAQAHHLKSVPRAHRGDLQPLDQEDNNKEATRKPPKMEKRKLRMEWWDPTVWGGPVTLAEREQSLSKTCPKFHSDLRKLSFPTGKPYYQNTVFISLEH
ncbi:uncharacterized protein LOC131904018 [Peromyscus eremicus]|uniref:uncharacterized protein LOC131904018 n=1 Tax=Peromyscus eremicus TaxID=42410 RepID=UPI0027DD642D|nr:uncharacterized protein LOC131904018 [Peromyscus eremicus]